jgi:hypothetical protein
MDNAGSPIANVPVAYATEGVTASTRSLSAGVVTNASGMFEIQGLASGDHTIVFGNGTGYTQSIRTVHIPSLGELRDMVQGGTALDANGNVISAASLQLSGNPMVSVALDPDPALSGPLALIEGPTVPSVVVLYPLTGTSSSTLTYTGSSILGGPQSALPTGTQVTLDYGPSVLPRYQVFTSAAGGSLSATGLPKDFEGSVAVYAVLGSGVASNLVSLAAGRLPTSLNLLLEQAPELLSSSPPTAADPSHYFDPGTAAAPTPFVLSFSRAISQSSGTVSLYSIEVENYLYYEVDLSWNPAGTVLTVTPKALIPSGVAVNLALTGFVSTDGSPLVLAPLTYATRPVLTLLSSNALAYRDAYGSSYGVSNFAVGSSIVLNFNAALTGYNGLGTYLSDPSGGLVPATLTISGSSLTIDPSASLDYATGYTVNFDVSAGGYEAWNSLADGFAFDTELNTAALGAITLNLDPTYQEMVSGTTSYEFGDSSAYVYFTSLEPGNPDIAYYYQTKSSSQSAWSPPSAVTIRSVDLSAARLYATLAIPALSPLADRDIRLFASRLDGVVSSLPSGTVTVTDATAPAAPTYSINDNTFLNNTSGSNKYVNVTFSLPGAEPMELPTSTAQVSFSPTVAAFVERVTYAGDPSTFVVTIRIPNGVNISGSSLVLPVRDAAGNNSVGSVAGAYTTPLTFSAMTVVP